jgi:hypothetical protein
VSQSIAELQATAKDLQARLQLIKQERPALDLTDSTLAMIASSPVGDWGHDAWSSAREELANRAIRQHYISKWEDRLQQVQNAIARQERKGRLNGRLISVWQTLFGGKR